MQTSYHRTRSRKAPRLLVLACLLLAAPASGIFSGTLKAWAASSPIPDKPTLALTLLEKLQGERGDAFWETVRDIEGLGGDVAPTLLRQLSQGTPGETLACAKVLLAVGDSRAKAKAIEALAGLVASCPDAGLRQAAIELYGRHGDPEEVAPALDKLLDDTVNPLVAIPAARTLWDVDLSPKARDKLIELLASKDRNVKRLSALALAEIDYFDGDVRAVLRSLKGEPSELGRRADALSKVIQLSRQLDADSEAAPALMEGADTEKLIRIKEERIHELEDELDKLKNVRVGPNAKGPLDMVLDEIILQIQQMYVDASKTDRKDLMVSAIAGLVQSLDPFSSFMGPEETKSFKQSLAGNYFGIGAQVHKVPGSPLEVARPIYGGPAYAAGILSGDQILEVDGAPTLPLAIEEIIKKLKGPSATKVKLKVLRRGWKEPREITVERRMVQLPSVYSELLPGGIGYILLLQFGDKSADEFVKALDGLEQQGMKGLVIDLRNDPGGRLDAAIRIVDQFVAGKLPIVTQKGRAEGAASREHSTYPSPSTRDNYPIAVLVNERSASASEIVSGALQDYGRAVIVGQRTYGKGSVQRLIPLSTEAVKALGGESLLRLTVQYYFLPLGRCIHSIRDKDGAVIQQGGIEPDVKVEPELVATWRFAEQEKLRTNSQVLDYTEKHAAEIQRLFLEGDERSLSRYPDFEKLYKSLETPVPRDDLRKVLRRIARQQLEDAQGKEFACDFQEDVQLLEAIRETLKKLGIKPGDVPRYRSLFQEPNGEKSKGGTRKL